MNPTKRTTQNKRTSEGAFAVALAAIYASFVNAQFQKAIEQTKTASQILNGEIQEEQRFEKDVDNIVKLNLENLRVSEDLFDRNNALLRFLNNRHVTVMELFHIKELARREYGRVVPNFIIGKVVKEKGKLRIVDYDIKNDLLKFEDETGMWVKFNKQHIEDHFKLVMKEIRGLNERITLDDVFRVCYNNELNETAVEQALKGKILEIKRGKIKAEVKIVGYEQNSIHFEGIPFGFAVDESLEKLIITQVLPKLRKSEIMRKLYEIDQKIKKYRPYNMNSVYDTLNLTPQQLETLPSWPHFDVEDRYYLILWHRLRKKHEDMVSMGGERELRKAA